jgi:hypothetical protein
LFQSRPMLSTELRPDPSTQRPRVGVLVGSHLCGRLSVQAIELFRSLPCVPTSIQNADPDQSVRVAQSYDLNLNLRFVHVSRFSVGAGRFVRSC